MSDSPASNLYIPPSAQAELLRRAAAQAVQTGQEIILPDGKPYKLVASDDPMMKTIDTLRHVQTQDALLKSIAEARARGIPYRVNPTMYSFGSYQGVKDMPSALKATMAILRMVPMKNPVVAVAIQRRKDQCSNWTRRERFPGDTGFKISMRDTNEKPTAEDRKRAQHIEDILIYGGIRRPHPKTGKLGVWNSEGVPAGGLAVTTQRLLNDSLILDAAAFEIQQGMNARKFPVSWWDAVDASLIRFAITEDTGKDAVRGWGGPQGFWNRPYQPEIRTDAREVAFVKESASGQGIEKEYTNTELGYLVRNPRTDEWVQGYGMSEIERMLDIVTGLLYGISYNKEFFDNNHIPPGLLALTGQYGDEVLQSFRSQLAMMAGGIGQFHTLPIISSPTGSAGQYIPLRQDASGGMYWKEWILFCGTIIAALFGMDANELNLANFGQSTAALSNPNPESKIQYAQESGLETILSKLGSWYDRDLVELIDPHFTFAWTGLQKEDKEMEIAESEYRMQFAMTTPNRELARQDERPIYDPLDEDLWQECLDKVQNDNNSEDLLKDEIEQETVKLYKDKGGLFARWPDAPIGNPSAMQLWMQEHQIQPQMPSADAFGAQTGQPGQEPGTEQQEPPPGEGEPLGPDTHIDDVGAALLRRGQAGASEQGAPPQFKTKMAGNGRRMGKNLIEVTIRADDPARYRGLER